MTVLDFIMSALGVPTTPLITIIYYIIAAVLFLVILDGIFSFIIGSIGSLFHGGRK